MVIGTQLPDEFAAALSRVGHDLHVRQFNGLIGRIEFEAHYEPYMGVVCLYSNVTPQGGTPSGTGVSGAARRLTPPEHEIAVSFADLVQEPDRARRDRMALGRRAGF